MARLFPVTLLLLPWVSRLPAIFFRAATFHSAVTLRLAATLCFFATLGFAAIFCFAASAQAQDPTQAQSAADTLVAVPNRPTFATTAETVQRGVFEIEYGGEAGDGHQNINGLLKFGLVKNLELRFANNPLVRDGGIAGTGDSGAGFKYKLFPQTKILPTFSALYTATIPTAPATRGAGASGHSAQLLATKDFGKHHFDFNEGVQFAGRPGGSEIGRASCRERV